MAQSDHGNSNVSTHSAYSSDIRSSALLQPIPVAEYLFRRLHEVGIRAVHGVAGEHNQLALEFLEPCGLNWVNNVTALNAGYAADGYARIKGIAALITTFGAGELSALNAIAGSYAESVPVIHIVGTPSTYSQRNAMLLHHPLGNGNSNTFADMSRSISCATAALNDPSDVADRIDHAIRECWVQSRPVYITLPTDMVQPLVEGDRLRHHIDLSPAPNDPDKEDYVVEVVLRYLQAAKNPIILVDAGAIRHHALLEIHDLVERSSLPTFVSPMGKGAVNEMLPNYCGVYAGDASEDEVRERVEFADLVLSIGALKSDFSTATFNYRLSELSTIDFCPNMVRVKYSEYQDVRPTGILRKLVERIGQLSVVPGPNPSNSVPFYRRDSKEEITHNWFWKHMVRWLQPSDIVITDPSAAHLGIWETRFPPNVTAINQVLWGSAGYATAACQGAAIAAQELMQLRPGKKHRTILFASDSSFQLSAQELSTMIREKLNPIIFLLCADTAVTSPTESSNPAQSWRYKDLLPAFGAQKTSYQSCTLSTKKQVHALFADQTFNDATCLQFVELRFLPLQDSASANAARYLNSPVPPPPLSRNGSMWGGSSIRRNGSVSTHVSTAAR